MISKENPSNGNNEPNAEQKDAHGCLLLPLAIINGLVLIPLKRLQRLLKKEE